jgi:hypothetical protein
MEHLGIKLVPAIASLLVNTQEAVNAGVYCYMMDAETQQCLVYAEPLKNTYYDVNGKEIRSPFSRDQERKPRSAR